MKLKDFFEFRYMMTPSFIQLIWALGSAVILLTGVVTLANAGRTTEFLLALVWLIGSLVGWRISCELLILLFRIYDEICKIRADRQTGA